MAEVTRIDVDDPDVDTDQGQRLLYHGELFSGEVEERSPNGALISLDAYSNGVQDGPSREWYPDGSRRGEGTMRQGRPVGTFREWHPNGVLASERVIADDGLTLLSSRKWDETGQIIRDWVRQENS